MMIQALTEPAIPFTRRPRRTENWSIHSRSVDKSNPPGILIADADPSIRTLAALKRRGFHVWLAADGEDALEIYGLYQHAINLVLLSVHMPRLDGPETAKVLRDFDPNVVCGFMGERFADYSVEDLESLTPLPFFEKPIENIEMLWLIACDHQVELAN